jgi:hypothetical protein
LPDDTERRLKELLNKAILAADGSEAEIALTEFLAVLSEHVRDARAVLGAQALIIRELNSGK